MCIICFWTIVLSNITATMQFLCSCCLACFALRCISFALAFLLALLCLACLLEGGYTMLHLVSHSGEHETRWNGLSWLVSFDPSVSIPGFGQDKGFGTLALNDLKRKVDNLGLLRKFGKTWSLPLRHSGADSGVDSRTFDLNASYHNKDIQIKDHQSLIHQPADAGRSNPNVQTFWLAGTLLGRRTGREASACDWRILKASKHEINWRTLDVLPWTMLVSSWTFG